MISRSDHVWDPRGYWLNLIHKVVSVLSVILNMSMCVCVYMCVCVCVCVCVCLYSNNYYLLVLTSYRS